MKEVRFMSCKIKNVYGEITIGNDVVARIAGMAAMESYGVVGMAAKNVKDGIWQLLKKENLTKGIMIVPEDMGIRIDAHIVVEYGTNIAAVCESLISSIKYNVESSVGITVGCVNIFVEGIRVNK
jgi:uncharacterized alkaline shock family protein YloU